MANKNLSSKVNIRNTFLRRRFGIVSKKRYDQLLQRYESLRLEYNSLVDWSCENEELLNILRSRTRSLEMIDNSINLLDKYSDKEDLRKLEIFRNVVDADACFSNYVTYDSSGRVVIDPQQTSRSAEEIMDTIIRM